MNDFDQFERRLAAAIRSDADLSIGPFKAESIARAAIAGTQPGASRLPRASSRPTGRLGGGRGMTLLAAAALLLVGGALAAGSGVLRLPSIVPPVPAPSVAVVATASPDATSPSPSEQAGPSAAPSSSAVAPSTGVWIATGSMGTPRYGHTAVRLLDGRVLVVGGAGGESDPSTAELYDPVSGTWSATGSMLRFHDGFGATLLRDGKVLVGDVEDRSLDDRADWITGAEVYDPASGTWTLTGKMVVHDPGSAALLRDGTVLVSGEDGSQLYHPATGTWTATGAMVTPRYGGGAPILLPDGRVLVAGGLGLLDNALDSAELYDPATGTWTSTASMHVPKGGARLTLLPNGKVLVTGGSPPVVPPTPPELYDPTTGAWTVTGDYVRADARYLSPTLLSDGTVLVVSSHPESFGAEVYDPGTGAWTATGTMLRPHNDVPATVLLDGTVLMAGGSECREGATTCPSGATGSAELYVPAVVSPPPAVAAMPSPSPSPTPVPTAPPTPDAGPARGRSHPAGRTILEGHGQQQEFRTRDAVRGRGRRTWPPGAARRVRDPERRATRRHREGELPPSREGDGLGDLREPGTERRAGSRAGRDVPARPDPHQSLRASGLAEPLTRPSACPDGHLPFPSPGRGRHGPLVRTLFVARACATVGGPYLSWAPRRVGDAREWPDDARRRSDCSARGGGVPRANATGWPNLVTSCRPGR